MAAVAAVAAIATAAATAYSANQANKAAKRGYKHARSEAERKEMYEREAIATAQSTPGAKFAPVMMGFAADVFGRAFAAHGIKMPVEQMKQAMGLDRIIANNAAGRPWNYDAEQEARDEAERTRQAELLSMRRGYKFGDEGMATTGGVPAVAQQVNPQQAPNGPQASPMPAEPQPARPSYVEAAQGAYTGAPAGAVNLAPMTADESGYMGGALGQ